MRLYKLKLNQGSSTLFINVETYLAVFEADHAETLVVPNVVTAQHSLSVVVEHIRVFWVIARLRVVKYCNKQRLREMIRLRVFVCSIAYLLDKIE